MEPVHHGRQAGWDHARCHRHPASVRRRSAIPRHHQGTPVGARADGSPGARRQSGGDTGLKPLRHPGGGTGDRSGRGRAHRPCQASGGGARAFGGYGHHLEAARLEADPRSLPAAPIGARPALPRQHAVGRGAAEARCRARPHQDAARPARSATALRGPPVARRAGHHRRGRRLPAPPDDQAAERAARPAGMRQHAAHPQALPGRRVAGRRPGGAGVAIDGQRAHGAPARAQARRDSISVSASRRRRSRRAKPPLSSRCRRALPKRVAARCATARRWRHWPTGSPIATTVPGSPPSSRLRAIFPSGPSGRSRLSEKSAAQPRQSRRTFPGRSCCSPRPSRSRSSPQCPTDRPCISPGGGRRIG